MALSLGVITLAAVVIWYFSDKLEAAAEVLGYHLKMPDSVKGAVLYAIPSSFPEFCTATLAVVLFDEFEVGVGTIAGSAVFNVLIIPALSMLVGAAALKKRGKIMTAINISPHVFMRDGVFYMFVVFGLIGLAVYGAITKPIAIGLLVVYGLYILMLYRDTKKHQAEMVEQNEEDAPEMGLGAAFGLLFFSMGVIGGACYFLVDYTIQVAAQLGINSYVVAVILAAAATSIPDTLISVAAARKSGEDAEESIVNAFSSNIFDILVCLAVPALLYSQSSIEIDTKQSLLSIILLGATTLVALLMIRAGNRVTKAKSYVLLVMYALFVGAAIFNDELLALLGIQL